MSSFTINALLALGLSCAVSLSAAESTDHGALATLNTHCVMCNAEVALKPRASTWPARAKPALLVS
jgi:hypothetical protein